MYSSISYNDCNNFLKDSINFSISPYLYPANLLKGGGTREFIVTLCKLTYICHL